jgi:hypothetical protein
LERDYPADAIAGCASKADFERADQGNDFKTLID